VTVPRNDLLVLCGYHTTCAAHGYDLHYLNARACGRRSMAAADDPAPAGCDRDGSRWSRILACRS
jgi:5-deoxy-D-glucuronate isomerase